MKMKMLQNCHLNHTLKEGTTIQFPHVFDTESEGGEQGSQVHLILLLGTSNPKS